MPHGTLNAIMLPHVMRFNADAVPDAMSAIAEAMGEPNDPSPSGGGQGERNDPSPSGGGQRERNDPSPSGGGQGGGPQAVARLVASLPVPQRLHDAGVPEAILDSVAAEAATNSTVQANLKPVTPAALRELLRAAW